MNSSTTLAALVAQCRKLTRRQQTTDAELLRRLAGQRDAAAFEELLERHASLVWGVCRRIVRSEADCEDAFQAAFLALFRRANAIDPRRPLGAWLHGVAVRAALKAAAESARKPSVAAVSEQATRGDIADELANRELFRAVDEEIARLPVLLRSPFILCCLEGRTRDEAAMALGCSVSAIKSRLERSRELLRHRLERRGFGLPAAFLVLGLTGGSVRASLRAKALHSALGCAPPTVAALVPAAGASLTNKLTLAAVSLLMAGVLGFGVFRTMQGELPREILAPAKDAAPQSPQSPAAEKSEPRLDRFGDPLPPGAVRRFGTLRFRHNSPILHLAFTPDSKELIAGMAPSPLAVFERATGRRARTIGKSTFGNHWGFAVSPDGQRVVCGVMGTLWDLRTGKLIRQLNNDGGRQWWSVAFSPDGKIVAGATEFKAEIVLVEAATGKQRVHQTFKQGRGWPPELYLSGLQFSPDGKFLAALFFERRKRKNGPDEELPQVWLLDAAKGTLVRTIGSAENAFGSFAFQPDTGRLATVGRDGAIHFWDVNTGKEVHRLAAERKAENWGIVRFVAGGRHCALSALDRQSGTRFLIILDVKDGKELRRIKLGESHLDLGWEIALSPDGRTVATARRYGECVRIWDVASGIERLADAGHRAPATLSLSADGRTLTSRGEEGRVIDWDLRTGNGQIRPAEVKRGDRRPTQWIRLSPQVMVAAEEWTLHSPHWQLVLHYKTSEMEVKSRDGGKLLRKLKWPAAPIMLGNVLSPDGTHLAVPIHDNNKNAVLLWNPERENEPRQLVGPPTASSGYYQQKLAFTHDSKRLLVGLCSYNPAPSNALWEWDVATAKVVRKWPLKFAPDHLLLSSDDRLLITASNGRDPAVHVWDRGTGNETARLTDPLLPPLTPGKAEMERSVASLCRSADERFLAVVTHCGDGTGISVWDTAAWKPVRYFPWMRLKNQPHSLIFSRDGRSLFVANSDSTILEWDVSSRFGKKSEPLNTDRLNRLWWTLRETPDKAYPAVWEMLDRTAESVPFLIGKLAPVQALDERRVRRLLRQLDAEVFAERDEASRQLQALGEQTFPLLQQALQDKPSLEAKKRIEGLIDSLTREPGAEQLRLLRAVAVLEWSKRPEASEHLRRLAEGDPAARLTRAAKAARQRHSRKE